MVSTIELSRGCRCIAAMAAQLGSARHQRSVDGFARTAWQYFSRTGQLNSRSCLRVPCALLWGLLHLGEILLSCGRLEFTGNLRRLVPNGVKLCQMLILDLFSNRHHRVVCVENVLEDVLRFIPRRRTLKAVLWGRMEERDPSFLGCLSESLRGLDILPEEREQFLQPCLRGEVSDGFLHWVQRMKSPLSEAGSGEEKGGRPRSTLSSQLATAGRKGSAAGITKKTAGAHSCHHTLRLKMFSDSSPCVHQ